MPGTIDSGSAEQLNATLPAHAKYDSELTDSIITADKGTQKWEINRAAQTKVAVDLKVGAKVTIEYRVTTAPVEIKADKTKANSK